MPKKSFKDNPALAYLNTQGETQKTEIKYGPETESPPEAKGRRQKQEYWRVCLNLRPEFKEYVNDEAWKARKTATEYINDLIAADRVIKQAGKGK